MPSSSLSLYQHLEEKEVMHELINPEDFAVEVKNLPCEEFESNLELKAVLWMHLEQVIAEESNCIKELELAKHGAEIYQINFGLPDYSNMKHLIGIYNNTKSLVLEERRLEQDELNKDSTDS